MNVFDRAKAHFHKRVAEWWLSLVVTTIGIQMFVTPDLFTVNPIFVTFRHWISQPGFGLLCLFLGLGRATVLFINGMWRASPHLRAAFAFAGAFFWLQLCFGIAYANRLAMSSSIWPWFILLEMLIVFWATGDARVADDAAKLEKAKEMLNGAGRDN